LDTPLLKDEPEPKPPPWWLALPRDRVRVATAVLCCISSVFAYLRVHDSLQAPPRAHGVVNASVPSSGVDLRGVVWGQVLHGALCQDERRRWPDRGAWQCVVPTPIPVGHPVRTPTNVGTNCTHRRIADLGGGWECWTRIPVRPIFLRRTAGGAVYVGDRSSAVLGHRPSPLAECIDEARAKPSGGAWRCVVWKEVPPDQRFRQIAADDAPCTVREADTETGTWHCEKAA
jgi:hypothetical protein